VLSDARPGDRSDAPRSADLVRLAGIRLKVLSLKASLGGFGNLGA